MRALSVFLVNRRKAARRSTPMWPMPSRPGWRCAARPAWCRGTTSPAYRSDDEDLRIADLHYRDEAEYAVGRNTSAGWAAPDEAGVVRRAWTDPLPMAEVERVAPNEDIRDVEFGMEALAELAAADGAALVEALARPAGRSTAAGSTASAVCSRDCPDRRRETGERLIEAMERGAGDGSPPASRSCAATSGRARPSAS